MEKLTIDGYQEAANRTAKNLGDDVNYDLNHAALGLITEAGEFVTEVKRAVIYDKPITDEMYQHMVEELGDLMWYVALAATAMGISLEDIMANNIEKLRKRFPDAYTNEAAEARADKGGLSARES